VLPGVAKGLRAASVGGEAGSIAVGVGIVVAIVLLLYRGVVLEAWSAWDRRASSAMFDDVARQGRWREFGLFAAASSLPAAGVLVLHREVNADNFSFFLLLFALVYCEIALMRDPWSATPAKTAEEEGARR
jgi:hypothetical protein